MDQIVLYGALAVLGYYYLTRLFGFLLRKYDWNLWYRKVYLRSVHWRFLRWKKGMWMRLFGGGVHCEKCGSGSRLQYHHITYERLGRERLSDLQIICNHCHRQGSGRI